jgi:universal stress protein E
MMFPTAARRCAADRRHLTVPKISSILVVANRDDSDKALLEKAVRLARRLGSRIELFLCDAEHAYTMRRAYDRTGVEEAWLSSFSDSCDYLETLSRAVDAPDVSTLVDAVCDSPHYQAVVNKVRACKPDLVMKSTAGAHPLRRFTLDSNDWELMRACPATLLLSRGKQWDARPRFSAMVDVSEEETPSLPEAIVSTADLLARACGGTVDVVYGEANSSAPEAGTHAAKVGQLGAEFHIGGTQVHVLNGNPSQSLAGFAAKEYCDAIVLGALSHRDNLTSLVGQLTGKLVEALTCDFVLIKAPEATVTNDRPARNSRADARLTA